MKICAAASCMFAGLLVVALVQGESKLAGVVLISLSTSISEMTFLAMTGFYEDSARTVGSYCAGNGLAVVLGNAYYLGKFYLNEVSYCTLVTNSPLYSFPHHFGV